MRLGSPYKGYPGAIVWYTMLMNQRFVFIHGNQSTHWSFAWTPWLKAQLDSLGCETFFETMPDSIIARAEYWLPFMQDHIQISENDIIIGWSSGAVAAMRYAENHTVKGLALISPSYTDLDDELEKQSGYFNAPWQWDKIKANSQTNALITGDNDPYIPQDEFNSIAKELDPTRIIIPNGEHFIERNEFPELLDYIRSTYVKS